MICWRIVNDKHASSAFDGEGSKRWGGRWTPKGYPVVYTARTESLAALELFVQLGEEGRYVKYVCFKIEIPEDVMIGEIDRGLLPLNWQETPAPDALKAFGVAWLAKRDSAVLRVPSALVLSECNYVINPLHPDFEKIIISRPDEFCYDPRMWKKE